VKFEKVDPDEVFNSNILPLHWIWEESPQSCWVAIDNDGRFASCFFIFNRLLFYGPVQLSVGSIGGLFTLKRYRGFRLARKLLRTGIKAERGYCGFIANSRRLNTVFTKVGFRSIGPSLTREDQDLYWRSGTVSLLYEAAWSLDSMRHF
jgi:GNAT superfamily N-acetyltransferase